MHDREICNESLLSIVTLVAMRFFHIIVALLILSLLQQCLGISCKDTKGNDVDAWFFFTPPKLVDSKLLVFAQRSNREVTCYFINYKLTDQ